jgi:K+ transporter
VLGDLGSDVFAAVIVFCVVVLATLVIVCIWMWTRGRRRLCDANEPKLTNAAKHFVADAFDQSRGR